MAKFGKKVIVDNDLSKYLVGVIAPSGWGKSSLMYKVAEKLWGDESYICADFGSEDGYAAISGAVVEKCATWKHFKAMVDDIVKNKETDYPELRLIIWDTLDAAFEVAEAAAIADFNREHLGEPNFKPISSVNALAGGYGKGLDMVISYVKKEINRLKKVGVGTWFCAHCKERDQTDLFTGNTYTQLGASLTNRYFGSIKDISHCIGFGYYSREMEHIEVGEANPITKKKKTREAVVREDRRIRFRDDDYLCDAKSRFAEIEAEIILDADEFIRVLTDAVDAERNKTNAPKKETPKKSKPAPAPVVDDVEEPDELDIEVDIDLDVEVEVEEVFDADAARTEIRNKNKAGTPEQKAKVKATLNGVKLNDASVEILKEILKIFE